MSWTIKIFINASARDIEPRRWQDDVTVALAMTSGTPSRLHPQHSQSMPQIQRAQSEQHPNVAPRWNRLRSLIPQIAGRHQARQASTVAPQSVNITDELIAGGLSALVLRLWFERDERDHRRVPILFHRLRIRVSDSLHPLHGNKAVFRIECEYANGAVRWVVYRQLREFLSLHAHYTVSNAYFRNAETLPDFPMMSLPYFKFLKERGRDVGRADFARLQREALENYLIGLIRAVMWHPSANRLAGFLEISALMVSLAQSGGAQYKAGMLRIDAVGNKGTFGRRATSWRERKTPKWCSVRESYLVVHEEVGELTVWDVFLIDTEFKIERPTRYLRQGLNLLQHFEDDHPEAIEQSGHESAMIERLDPRHPNTWHKVGSIKSHMENVFHIHRHHDPEIRRSTSNVHEKHVHGDARHGNGHADTDPGHHRPSADTVSSSSSSSSSSRPVTPMLDPSTNTNPLLGPEDRDEYKHDEQEDPNNRKRKSRMRANEVSKHTFYIENSQMRLKLYAKNERQMLQWIAALERVARDCHYTGKNRFDSFAPIRLNVAAQWLVDGRDYFWNLSRAILLATECIYIHDWWLSPELQMRRPGMPKYRIDNLLERKAKEGVKIYIIVYQEVSSRTTPTDSNYTKQRLTALHPNIMVQRSPSHFQTGTFYWAHHEKLCVIDQAIAFMGGLDLCFGRWDTPQHAIIDDPENMSDGAEQIWPGKDYSNPRISDFHTLNKPDDDMYDRTKVPRMPWHDVGMQVVGQPARDLARHFVQRWNYLLRIKNHTRVMPMLLPPPEFRPGELTQMGLTGTCEFQITRSAGPWSLGTPERIEHSIQNAYLKAIQMSEHFVYIENQFFITSTVVNEVAIENKIGDALVARIIRAHQEKTPWKCCVVIPLIPGFPYSIDHSDASSIRIIIECQNRTICRGPNSIFGRLRKEGIDPDDYIAFFSLRNWGKLRDGALTTEEVYIHGKVCIVDDRLAIIGSANINERSQRGDRDSEIAAVIRDTDMLECTMAGKPFKVGRFAHTLRVRLMREHIGVDVDGMHEEDLMASEPTKSPDQQSEWDPENEEEHGRETGVTHIGKKQKRTAMGSLFRDTLDGVEQAIHGTSEAGDKDIAMLLRKTGIKSKGLDLTADERFLVEERQMYNRDGQKETGFPSSVVPTLEEKIVAENRPPDSQAIGHSIQEELKNRRGSGSADQPEEVRMKDGQLLGAPANAAPNAQLDREPPHAKGASSDATAEEEEIPGVRALLRKQVAAKLGQKPWALPTPTPRVDPDGFEDPVCDDFWKNVWLACAVHNTEIFRKVFHTVPDDLVTTWKQYREFVLHHERLNQPVRQSSSREPLARMPSESVDQDESGQLHTSENAVHAVNYAQAAPNDTSGKEYVDGDAQPSHSNPPTPPAAGPEEKTRGRRASRAADPFDESDKEEMENLLQELRGHLVLYPTRFLEGEDAANNFLFNADRLMPLPIYD
ncbi:phospholipase D [Daedalea quercina L-15889]|uniref:Phospholipase n=1 Tax=Daedalea quercina L-15889 TaxID=1314783 RepID=A0A165LMQ0_9APHY|nr:phospholipase D [Daedalea quercina L-15889]